jgi:hypothetical protein
MAESSTLSSYRSERQCSWRPSQLPISQLISTNSGTRPVFCICVGKFCIKTVNSPFRRCSSWARIQVAMIILPFDFM